MPKKEQEPMSHPPSSYLDLSGIPSQRWNLTISAKELIDFENRSKELGMDRNKLIHTLMQKITHMPLTDCIRFFYSF